jgi:hypothetical protein
MEVDAEDKVTITEVKGRREQRRKNGRERERAKM